MIQPHFFQQKRIVLGITGSIAAYKSAELTRRLRELGADVRVIMTENAKEFITPLTLQALSGNPIHDDLFDLKAEAAMGHIELARWADLVLIAPASAECLANLATGSAKNLLATVALASKAPVALAPAMNQAMWLHSATQANKTKLQALGFHIFGPDAGLQACGDVGPGRLLEVEKILAEMQKIFSNDVLAGVRILLTGGPTQEHIDPIRYLSNGSSGKMAYALATAARDAGASVSLISGPVHLAPPPKIQFTAVTSADEMHAAVLAQCANQDIFISVAAVSDYKCATISAQKIHKSEENFILKLERTPDIALSVRQQFPKIFLVGFAAETENVLARAQEKRIKKGMNMIIANRIAPGIALGSDDNEVSVIHEQNVVSLPRMHKNQLALALMQMIAKEYFQTRMFNHSEVTT